METFDPAAFSAAVDLIGVTKLACHFAVKAGHPAARS
jgi:hypothetical protein